MLFFSLFIFRWHSSSTAYQHIILQWVYWVVHPVNTLSCIRWIEWYSLTLHCNGCINLTPFYSVCIEQWFLSKYHLIVGVLSSTPWRHRAVGVLVSTLFHRGCIQKYILPTNRFAVVVLCGTSCQAIIFQLVYWVVPPMNSSWYRSASWHPLLVDVLSRASYEHVILYRCN